MPYKDPDKQKEYDRQKYQRTREHRLAKQKVWYAENKEDSLAWHREYAKKNRKKINARTRAWKKKRTVAQRTKEREWRRQYNALHPEIRRETNRRTYQRNPEKIKARHFLYRAIKYGIVKRPDHCSHCGLVCTPHGHHPDYMKPLEVIWLCDPCHKKIHAS